MPFRSERQRRYMWVHHPRIAEAWAHGKHTKHGGKKMGNWNVGKWNDKIVKVKKRVRLSSTPALKAKLEKHELNAWGRRIHIAELKRRGAWKKKRVNRFRSSSHGLSLWS